MTGKFITIEGADGAGKTTQIHLLDGYLKELGYETILTREPGGTQIGEKIRELLLDPSHKELVPIAEVLLYAAARAQHLQEKILPALKQGKIIICDRFTDSSIAYQGYGRGYGREVVEQINNAATERIQPDITFFLDLNPEVGISRKKEESGHDLDRMEQEKIEFHKRVYQGYVELSCLYPKRIKRIQANLTKEAVHQEIKKEIISIL